MKIVFSLCSFSHRGKPVFITANENRFFPVWKNYTGKTLFWPCTGPVRDCSVAYVNTLHPTTLYYLLKGHLQCTPKYLPFLSLGQTNQVWAGGGLDKQYPLAKWHFRARYLLKIKLQIPGKTDAFYKQAQGWPHALVWPQWWSFPGVSQQEVDFSKKISKTKTFFLFDFHRCSHRPSKIGHHFSKQSGSKIEVFKKW